MNKIKYRAERFGGIIFDWENAKTLYVDRDWMTKQFKITRFPKYQYLSAPEIVYWTSTIKCNYQCKGCYVLDSDIPIYEMTTEQAKYLIDECAKNSVFMLAIGGGEPYLREDIFKLAEYSRSRGVLPTIVTNGSRIDEVTAEKSKIFGQVNVSIDGTREYYQRSRGVDGFNSAVASVKLLVEHGNRVGINMVVSKDNLENVEQFIEFVKHNLILSKIIELNILIFKPFGRGKHYAQNYLTKDQQIALITHIMNSKWNKIRFVELCTPLLKKDKYNTHLKSYFGRGGCGGGYISLNIRNDGMVTPCSYSQHLEKSFGNILTEPLAKIWRSDAFNEFRKNSRKPKCNTCSILECRGICQFVPDLILNEFDCLKNPSPPFFT